MKTTRLPIVAALAVAIIGFVAAPAARAQSHTTDPAKTAAHAETAAHGEGEKAGVVPTAEQGIVPMVVAIGVFAVVFGILATQVWPKILGGLKDRENKIRQEIESAEMARKQAKDALEQYQKSLADARAEAQKMIDATRAQQASLASELKAKAEVELSAMREKATRDIENAKRAAIAEIYTHSGQLATMMASKILKRQITSGDQQQLIEESLSQLQGSRN